MKETLKNLVLEGSLAILLLATAAFSVYPS